MVISQGCATVREKSLGNEKNFQVSEKSGNFNFSQGTLEIMIKVREMSGNRPYLESAIFETCMISTFILLSFESK